MSLLLLLGPAENVVSTFREPLEADSSGQRKYALRLSQ